MQRLPKGCKKRAQVRGGLKPHNASESYDENGRVKRKRGTGKRVEKGRETDDRRGKRRGEAEVERRRRDQQKELTCGENDTPLARKREARKRERHRPAKSLSLHCQALSVE
eukprot:2963700-Pleurochrysis_carterae.AAC.1